MIYLQTKKYYSLRRQIICNRANITLVEPFLSMTITLLPIASLPGNLVKVPLAKYTLNISCWVVIKPEVPHVESLLSSVVFPHRLASVLLSHVERDAVAPHQAFRGIVWEVHPEHAWKRQRVNAGFNMHLRELFLDILVYDRMNLSYSRIFHDCGETVDANRTNCN